MPTRYLYLVRHGQYVLDRDQRNYGDLTSLGRKQAKRLARRLRTIDFDVIHHSSMVRAEQTAALIGEQLPSVPMRRAPILQEGMPERENERPTAATRAVRKRMENAFERYARPSRKDRHELLVCHGNVIRNFMLYALDVDVSRWLRMDITHCGVSVLRVLGKPRRTVVSYFNDASHLTQAQRTVV